MSYYSWKTGVQPQECEQLINEFDKGVYGRGKVGSGKDGGIVECLRKTEIQWIEKDLIINRVVGSFINEANLAYFKFKLSGTEKIQFAKYSEACMYDWHTDINIDQLVEEPRKLSLMIQLSDPDDYKGGEFQLYNGTNEPIEPDVRSQGSVIVFDSRMWHRIKPITEGVRFSIVCWCIGPRFV